MRRTDAAGAEGHEMTNPFIQRIRLDGVLSFAPGATEIELGPLNVLIGPNGSGKSNLLDTVCLLAHLPRGDEFQAALRDGGGAGEWLRRGSKAATIELRVSDGQARCFDYKLKWAPRAPGSAQASILEESFIEPSAPNGSAMTYFRTDGGQVELATRHIGPSGPEPYKAEVIARQYFDETVSILSQRKTQGAYPENIWLGDQFSRISAFRDWTFGQYASPRSSQRTDMPIDGLLPTGSNLALMVQELLHRGRLDELNRRLRQFLPRAESLTPRIVAGPVLLYLKEEGAADPIPATRLSDGTLRFIALLVALLSEPPPPVLCIEEPELGLHPDALSLVAELLIEASQRMQLIVTTHSDALVSALTEHVESVLVCEHLGGTQIRRLSADALSHWLEKYRLGDLWRMGELGGNP